MQMIVPEGTDKQDDETQFSLPEQRHRQAVHLSNRGVRHVRWAATFKSNNHDGRWVRRAADISNLCGTQHYTVVGIDAADWSTERQPVNVDEVTCKRCRERYENWLKKRPGGGAR
jgi:hypothetical protein